LTRLRDEAGDLLEHSNTQLDWIDGDPDFEPSLCAGARATTVYRDNYAADHAQIDRSTVWTMSGLSEVDLEEECEDEGATAASVKPTHATTASRTETRN
jgi:hypothetical protein